MTYNLVTLILLFFVSPYTNQYLSVVAAFDSGHLLDNNVVPSCNGNISQLEYSALESFYNSTGGPNWRSHGNQTKWVFPSSFSAPCENGWQGVVCDKVQPSQSDNGISCTVISLLLPFTNIRGYLTTQLGFLSSLTRMQLNNNHLSGSIPSQLGYLSSLKILFLYENSFTGSIPFQLGNLLSLSQLSLFGNYLMGTIPSQLGNLSSLTLLVLEYNSLTGTIPSQLGNLSSLTLLYLYGNSLAGTIPSQLGNLLSLTQLYCYLNYLTGSIPSQLSELSSLKMLNLKQNYLTGTIPSQLGKLSSLTELNLQGNFLTGSFPSQLGELTSLATLDLSANTLTKSLPMSVTNLYRNLTSVDLSSNQLTGNFPIIQGALSKCYYFNVSFNSFSGSISSAIGSIGSEYGRSTADKSAQLYQFGVVLDISQNSFSGTIPAELFTVQMQTIALYSNCLSGSLPVEMCSAVKLQTLVMDTLTSGDQCRATSPKAIFHANFAKHFMASSIPSCVWSLTQLQTLHLSGNGLHGPLCDIPASSVLVDLDVSNNYLTGSVPLSLQSYSGIQQLALANNKLSGTLSESFVVGNNMTVLTLSVNRLSGELPQSIITAPASVSTIDVLSGNLFACGTALPRHDSFSASYACGSNTLDDSLYVSVFVGLQVVAAVLIVWKREYLRSCSSFFADCLELLSIWWIGADSRRGKFLAAMDVCRRVVLYMGTFYMVVCLPMYCILNTAGMSGTVQDQYTWVTTATFLHGYPPVICIGIFVALSAVGTVSIVERIQMWKLELISPVPSSSRRIKWSNVMERMFFHLISIVVLVTVNVAYVHTLLSVTLSAPLIGVLQFVLGVFKIFWRNFYITPIAVARIRKHDDISKTALLVHEVAMNVVNFIVAPCLATLGTDGDCFYNAILGQSAITSSFDVTEFFPESFTFSDGASISFPIPYRQQLFITVNPPWLYSYQCTSAILTNYVPVLIFTYITIGFVAPLAMTSILLLSTVRPVDDSQSDSPLRRLFPAGVEEMYDSRNIVADIMLDLASLMTYGLAAPLLAAVLMLKQLNFALYWRLWVGRYLHRAENVSDAVTRLDDVGQAIDGNLSSLSALLIVTVSLFWGAFVFDMIADVYGPTTGAVAAMVCMAAWVAIVSAAYFGLVLRKRATPHQGPSDIDGVVRRSTLTYHSHTSTLTHKSHSSTLTHKSHSSTLTQPLSPAGADMELAHFSFDSSHTNQAAY